MQVGVGVGWTRVGAAVRGRAGAFVLAAAVLASGCGGASSDKPGPAKVAASFFALMAEKRFDQACEHVLFDDLDERTCPGVLRTITEEAQFEFTGRVRDTRVSDDTAEVDIRTGRQTIIVELERDGDEWKVADFRSPR